MKVKPIIVGVTAIAALGLSGTAAAGGGGPKFKAVRVNFQPTDVPVPTITPVCDARGTCVYTSTATATQTGDLDGATVEADAGGIVGTTFQQTLLGTFTGTVSGCGTGTFLYNGVRTSTEDGRSDGTYVIVPGSGTGGLAGITGVMEQHAPAGSTTTAPVRGLFRCAAH